MDLHRLRVVGFDTSVSKKADEKYNVENEKYEQGDWKTSTYRNNDEIGYPNQRRNVSKSPPRRLSNKCLSNKIPPETSKIFLGDNSTPLGASVKIYPNNRITRPGTSQKRRPGASNKFRPGTSKKHLDDISITSPPTTWKKRSFTIRKSKSEIFKIPPKNKSIKCDLKLNLRETDPTEQFQDNAYSRQRKRTLNLRKRNSRVHQKVQNAKENRDKNDVHFLYRRETPSFMRFCRKRAENEKTKIKNKRNCRLTNDIYGFHKSNRSMDQHLYQMSCFKFIHADKLPFKKIKMIYHRNRKPKSFQPVEKCFCKHHAMRVLKSDYRNCEKPSIFYNLNTRPHSRRFQRKNYDYDQEQGEEKKPECLQCMGKDETVEVSPSKLSPEPIGFCDAGTTPSNVEQPASSHPQLPDVPEECLPPQTATVAHEFSQKPSHPCLHNPIAARSSSAQDKCKKERITTKKIFITVTNGCKGFFSRLAKHIVNFHSKRELSGAGCVKYVCVGLLIVIWFPCLLAGVLAWVVFFPGKLINMVKCTSKRSLSINRCRRKDPRSEYQRMCFENYLPQQKTSFISSVARWCTRTVGTVLNSFKAVISVFKFKRKEPRGRAGSSCFHSSQIPRKRYTLFYVNNRGWVMKPLRRRKKRAVPRSRVVQNMRCDFIPKMTFFDNWQQTTPPSKDAYFVCPVNKKGRKKRRRSSRAGDAYQLQCTEQWPSCACGDVNPPGLTQVNIPSIFSRSADETLSKNKKKCKSKVLSDYIAQEDLAKNHLGQPKNGAWPFRFDFNYPYGTKHPLIMNLETYGANRFGLGDDDKIASSRGFINSMQSKYIRSCKLNRLRTQAVNRWIDSNYPCRKNRITALTNKKLCSQRKILPMRNKRVLAALSKSALIKDANTSTHKIYYAHKAQNTLKHIPYQKVVNKFNKIKNSNLNLTTTKKAYKCKYSVPTQKYLSTAKIKSNVKPNTVVNSSFINLNNLSKRGGECKPHHISVATQKQANTINTRISADHNKALHHFCRHNQYKQGDKYEPHRISATHKQSNTERNIALHRPSTYNQSKQSNNKIPHNIPLTLKQSNTNRNIASQNPSRHEKFRQATHKKSNTKRNIASHNSSRHQKCRQATHKQWNTSDIIKKVKRNMALISPQEDKRLYQTRHIPVAIQMKPDTTNNMTMTSRDVVLDDPHEQYKQGYRHELRQISVATQIQPQTAENATITSHDVALNCPSGEKHEKSKQMYKYQIPYATQKQSQIANKVTMTSQDVVLNCPSGEKHEQSKQVYKSQQIPVVTQVHPSTAVKTKSTFCDSYALDDPHENKHEQCKQRYRYGPCKIHVATQMKMMKADNKTMTSRDVALSCHGEVKPSTATKDILCLPRTADKNTSLCLGYVNPSTTNKDILCIPRTADKITCEPDHRLVAIQKQSNTIDITTMTSRNHVCGHAQSIQTDKFKTSKNRDIASNFFGGVNPSTVNKEILCIPKTAEKDTIYPQKHNSLEVHLKRNISKQKQDFKIGASDCRYGLATQSTQISRVGVNRSKLKVECECRVNPLQNKAEKKTATTHNTQPKLTQVPSHTLQEQPKSFGVSDRQNKSQTTPFIDKQELTSDPTAPSSHPNCIERETPTSTTDIQKLPGVCKCACYTIPPLSSEFPQHSLIAPKVHPDVPKVIKTLSKSLKSPAHLPSKISQATNTNVTPQRSKFDKEMEQIANKGETYKSGSAKEPSKLFDLAASCVCGANHVGTEAQAMHPQSSNNNSQTTPLADKKGLVSDQEAIVTKSFTFPTHLEEFPCHCKCECNIVLRSPHHGSQAKHSSQHALKTALETDKRSVKEDTLEVNKTLSKSLKSPEHLPFQISQSTSPLFGIASNCHCEETPLQNESDKEISPLQQETEADSKKRYINKTSSPKVPLSQKPEVTKVSERSFGIAIDCTCRTNQPVEVEKSLHNELTGSKNQTVKETLAKSPLVLKKSTISKFPKTEGKNEFNKSSSSKEPHSLKSKRSPDAPKIQSDNNMSKEIKRLSNFKKSPENATLLKSKRSIVKVDKSLSQFPKLPDFFPQMTKLHQKCPCQVSSEILRDPVSERLYGNRELTTASKKNIVKVGKSMKKFHPIPECLKCTEKGLGKCPCPIESLQYPVSEQTRGTTERTTASKRNTEKKIKKFSKSPECVPCLKNWLHKFSFPVENLQETMPERSRISIFSSKSKRPSSHLDERCFRSGIPEAQSTTRRAPIGLCERPVDIYYVDKSSSSQLQSQCSRESQFPSSVNSLVKNVRSSLFSRKLSKQEKVSEHPKLSQSSTLSRYPSKTCYCSIGNREKPPARTGKSKYSESSCLFGRTHGKVKALKPLLVDKSSLGLQSVQKEKSHSCKMYRYLYPRVSQREQSKKSKHSSILISENKFECTTDDTSSTPKDGISHQISKTLFLRNSHSKLQQLWSQRNRCQYFAHSNRSQETLSSQLDMNQQTSKNAPQLSEKKSLLAEYYTMLPGMCKCAKEHLGKTVSHQLFQHFIRSQESKQKQFSKNIQSQYSSSQNADPPVPTMLSNHTQNPELLKSIRSSFNLLQSKQLIDKIRSITNIKTSNSRKNKHGKRENLGVQTAPIISGKCACWPDKLQQVTKKISHYSGKSVEKISPSQQPPGHQPTQPYKISHQPNVGTEAHTVNPQHLPNRQPSQVFQLKQLTEKEGKPFATISQLIKSDQAIPIIAGEKNNKTKHSSNKKLQPKADLKKLPSTWQHLRNTQPPVSKLDSLHSSQVKRFIVGKVDKQLDQLLKTDRVLPIIPGRCAGEQKIKTEHSSNNKVQSPTVPHPAHKATLRTDLQSELTQRQNQPRASKLSQPHISPHTGIIHNSPLHNFQPTRKKPCKCRSFKNECKQEVWVNSLHKIAKTRSPFQKSQLVSCMYSDFAKNTLRRQHTILQRPEIPQSLKKSQIQLYPQFQQIPQDQKLEPQIPIHLEKTPPELLQRNWAGDGRNRTAEGGVQQPYPDFNRVSMRYPGKTAPCNQPKSSNDESALRRAYKRRPLRCTPPREQKVCRRQKINVNSQTICVTKKQMKRATGIRGFCRCLRDAVRDAEREAWPTEFSCNPWVNTLKRKPCFWIYKTCPRAYPAFICICNGLNAIRRLFTLCLTFCFWSPLALCFYLCCDILCRR